jgi:HSP90 family molecular chaperone
MMIWMTSALDGKVSSVKTTSRLADSPAILVNHESAAMRRMMRMVEQSNNGEAMPSLGTQQLAVNPGHPIIQQLTQVYAKEPELAKMVAEQLFDDAIVAAGLLDDSRSMIPRINKLLEEVLTRANKTE